MKTILVIDDEPEFIETVRMRLEAGGYRVIGALDGDKGVRRARQEKPGLILLDLMMPNVDGFQALYQLKKDNSVKSIPVIIITARSETDYILDTGKLGAVDYIVKPVNMHELIKLVAKHIA